MKSLDDIDAPQDGVAFFTWGTREHATFRFKSEFGEPRFSKQGLLEAVVEVDGTEYIFAPGSRRLLFAMKPFSPVRGKVLYVQVRGEGMRREFVVSEVKPEVKFDRSAMKL